MVAAHIVVCVAMLGAQEPAKPAETPKQDEPSLKRAVAFASISGTVVSASTGEPLAGAEIQAIEKEGKAFQAAKTDATGAFQVIGLVSGTYTVSCSLSGYVTAKFPQESWRVPPFYMMVAAAQQVAGVNFRLQKNASISGVISGEDGKPLGAISVQAFSRYYTHEGVQLEPRGNGRTDSQGRYRIAALESGNYFIQAMKVVGPEGYGGVFYPDAVNLAGAKLVNLKIGQEVDSINLKLKKTPGYPVTGKLLDLRTNLEVKEGYTVTIAPEHGTSGVLATVDKDGKFHFTSLVSGKYRLTATMTDLRTGLPSRITKDIEVGQAPITDLVVQIGAGATVRVVVHAKEGKEGKDGKDGQGAEPPRRLALALMRREEAGEPGRAVAPQRYSMADMNTYEFHNVLAGEYLLILGSTVRPDTRHFFIEEITQDDKDVLETGFTVPEGLTTVQLSAVVNIHGGIVSGVAMDSKKQPLLGRAVVIVSADRAKRRLRQETMLCWTDSAGKFGFNGIVPGEYLAVLWTGGDPGEAQDPAFFDEVERNAAPVHVPVDGDVTFGLRSASSPPS
jgi:protocatechuate 3,4-dioxygenase beta subunit